MVQQLRVYQKELAERGKAILLKNNLLYLVFQMRVGKTATAYEIARLIKAKRVLLLTTPINISGHQSDYQDFGYTFPLRIEHYNYINIGKLKAEYDLIICDEAQKLGGFPKTSATTKALSEIACRSEVKIIYLSGTPTPESYSQIYHQFWISYYNPFRAFPTFYKWAEVFVDKVQKRISGHLIIDYSHARKDLIDSKIKHLFLSYTQEQAGFKVVSLDDEIVPVPVNSKIQQLVNILLTDRLYQFKNEDMLVCETAGSLQQKIHQLYSGTVIVDRQGDRQIRILDQSKADHIEKKYYHRLKIAVFYLFNGERDVLQTRFKTTSDPREFNRSGKDVVFIGQLNAAARGINLSSADILVFYNIPFSSELYQQARQRGQEKDKATKTRLVWLCSAGGIEEKIYARVLKKQSYTLSYFIKDYLN